MSPFRLAFLNLTRRKLPTVLAIVSIAMAVACGGILLRLYQLSSSRFSSMGKGFEVVVGAKAGGIEILLGSLNGEGNYPDYLPLKLYESLSDQQPVHFTDGAESDPNFIKSITPFVYFGKYNSYRLVGTNSTLVGNADLTFSEGNWSQNTDEGVIGSDLSKNLGIKVGDEISFLPWIAGHEGSGLEKLKVVGILSPSHQVWDRLIFSNLEKVQKTMAQHQILLGSSSIWGSNVLNYFLINLKPNGAQSLENLVNKRTVGQVINVQIEKEKLEDLTGIGKRIGVFVSFFILVLSGLCVSAMLVTRFEAMSSQLAVLRAIGYSKSELTQWLLWEGFLLGIIGVLIGIFMDFIFFPWLREILGTALPGREIAESSVLLSYPIWFFAIGATLLAVVVPLVKVYRQDVNQSLRGF